MPINATGPIIPLAIKQVFNRLSLTANPNNPYVSESIGANTNFEKHIMHELSSTGYNMYCPTITNPPHSI